MRLWTVTLYVKWSYHGKDELGDEMNYDVAAQSGEAAIEKAKKIAMRNSGWTDDDGQRNTIKSISLVGLVADQWIDG